MFFEQLRRAVEAAPRAELPARMVQPLLPFPRLRQDSSRGGAAPSRRRRRPDPTGYLTTCATASRRPWRRSATARRPSPWRRSSAGSGPCPAAFSPRSRLTGASWPSIRPLGSRRRGCAARSGRWKRSSFSTVPITSGSTHKPTPDGLHRKPVLFMFGGDYGPLFSAANRRAAAANEIRSAAGKRTLPHG